MNRPIYAILLPIVSIITLGSLTCMIGCDSPSAAQTDKRANGQTDKSGTGESGTSSSEPLEPGAGLAAMEKAAEANKYLFVLFWKTDDAKTEAMRTVLKEAIEESGDRADSVEINVASASERAIVGKYGVDRAPMPLLLAVASNGAITGGFPSEVEKTQILEAFVSPGVEKCFKPLQDNRLVLLCVQNENTESNDEALKGVRAFKADARFASATEIVMLDPADSAEASFLKDLEIDPATKSAVTVFLAPPGSPIAKYEGATSKEEIVAALEKASSSCGPGGCGPGGCGPR